jgi:hypothetical protein
MDSWSQSSYGRAHAASDSRKSGAISAAAGQVYGVVGPGLIFTQHVFRRDKYVADDQNAAGKKFIATWAAKRNAGLEGDRCTPS